MLQAMVTVGKTDWTNLMDKRKALETMLATKLNDAKAKALADVIAKKEDSKHNLLNLMKSELIMS